MGGGGVGGVSSLVKEQFQHVQQHSDSLICSCRQLLQSSGYVVYIICIQGRRKGKEQRSRGGRRRGKMERRMGS